MSDLFDTVEFYKYYGLQYKKNNLDYLSIFLSPRSGAGTEIIPLTISIFMDTSLLCMSLFTAKIEMFYT